MLSRREAESEQSVSRQICSLALLHQWPASACPELPSSLSASLRRQAPRPSPAGPRAACPRSPTLPLSLHSSPKRGYLPLGRPLLRTPLSAVLCPAPLSLLTHLWPQKSVCRWWGGIFPCFVLSVLPNTVYTMASRQKVLLCPFPDSSHPKPQRQLLLSFRHYRLVLVALGLHTNSHSVGTFVSGSSKHFWDFSM